MRKERMSFFQPFCAARFRLRSAQMFARLGPELSKVFCGFFSKKQGFLSGLLSHV
jgi:hypothetical protein